jgi:hypothetical protein
MSKLNETGSEHDSEGNQMQPCQRLRQPFVVTSQSPETSSPREAALNYPASRQQDEASLWTWQLDHLQPDAPSASSAAFSRE